MQIFEQKSTTKNGISLYSTKYNISKIICAAKPLIRTSSPLASRLIAYSSNAADFFISFALLSAQSASNYGFITGS